jgi:glycosyltransferase involved in cell wall biosynthesis
MSDVDLSIVIPVYNNSTTLDELLDRLVAVLEPLQIDFELILVDDGSRDDSFAILQRRAATDPRIRPFALTRNFGSQSAVCAGFDRVRGRYGVCMDADLDNCPEDLPRLLEPLDRGYDLVCGYRENRHAPFLTRQLPSRLMNAYAGRQTGIRLRDVGCGMRAFEARIVRDLAAEGEARRLLTPVFLRRARRVTEVPLSEGSARRSGGHSFLSLLGTAADYYMLTARRPFLAFGLLSLALTAVGVAAGFGGAGLGCLVLLATGLLAALASLVGEYCQRLYHLNQGTPFDELRMRGDHETIAPLRLPDATKDEACPQRSATPS